MGCLFVETSARTETGVRRAFCDVVERIAEAPELCGVQEPRKPEVSHPKSEGLTFEPGAAQGHMEKGDEISENRVRVIGSLLFTQNAIQFGGHCRG